ncbi:MAG: response regulator, partial [Anaerolineae bacterium]|nr:response regulator [Anaerolineae bacterium]
MTSPHTILIVDDEVNLRTTLAQILQTDGYAITGASNAQEALKYLQAGPYDITFIDLMMPKVSGLTLLKEIRALHPDMPVLILTANASIDSAIEAVRQGARDYLIKPIDPHQILARVKSILSEQNQPLRQRQIISQIQSLVAEMQQLNAGSADIPSILKTIPQTDPSRFLQRGPFTLDLHSRQATLNNNFIPLSPSNFDYLSTLIRHSPQPVSYQ